MPKKRRAPRPVRRPNFRPAPEPPASDSGAASEPAEAPTAAAPATSTAGPADTRVHRVPRPDRSQGRRLAQLRRNSSDERVVARGAAAASHLPTFAPGFIVGEMRRIVITSVALTALLIVLALILR